MAILQHGQNLMAKVPLIANEKQRALAEKQVRFEMQRLYERTFMDPERYRSDCKKYVGKALEKMYEAANRRRIDPEATQDRAAVAAAVRSGSGKADPSPAMPNLSNMLDKELAKFTRESFGF